MYITRWRKNRVFKKKKHIYFGYGFIFIRRGGEIFWVYRYFSPYWALNDGIDQACDQKVSALCPADGALLHPDPGRAHPGRSILYRKLLQFLVLWIWQESLSCYTITYTWLKKKINFQHKNIIKECWDFFQNSCRDPQSRDRIRILHS